jgi:hypothetical protein
VSGQSRKEISVSQLSFLKSVFVFSGRCDRRGKARVAVAGCLALLFGGSLLRGWAWPPSAWSTRRATKRRSRHSSGRCWGVCNGNPGRPPTPLCGRVPLRSTPVAERTAAARRQTVTEKRLLRERNFARKHPARTRNDANGHDFGAFGHGEGLYNDARVVQ